MNIYKQKNDAAPIRVYKPSGWMQLGFILIAIFVVIHFSVLTRVGFEMAWPMLVLIPIYGFMLWILIISSNQQHLAIYEDGLEYRMGNNRIFSTWEDMRYFEIRPQGKTSVTGIYTIAIEKRQEGNAFERLMLMRGYSDFIPLNLVRVPTRWDGCWTGAKVDTVKLVNTEFGQELLHYAPHLFEYGKEKQKNG